MKFRLISDIHLEFHKDHKKVLNILKSFQKKNKADYLILAGDITNFEAKNIEKFKELIKEISADYKKIFMVLGNHEYYGSDISKNDECVSRYKSLNICNNLIILDNETYIIERPDPNIEYGIAIFGSTLWSKIDDFSYNGSNDKYYIKKEFMLNKHDETIKILKDVLSNEDYIYIVVTHHLPSFKFIVPKYQNDPYNTMFASNCDFMFKDNIIYWTFGHTHSPINQKEEDIKFLCNPMGYPGERSELLDCVFSIWRWGMPQER